MNGNELASTGGSAPARADREAQEPEQVEIVDLGRASERTRGQISGFVIEPSAFPLRDF